MIIPASCYPCKHYHHGRTCDAFERIPSAIFSGADYHDKPWSGDRGIQFEAREGMNPAEWRVPKDDLDAITWTELRRVGGVLVSVLVNRHGEVEG